jgi:hypothetical protein
MYKNARILGRAVPQAVIRQYLTSGNGYNTLRRHLHVMGYSDNSTCRKCGAEEEISTHILCGCKALASLWHIHLGSIFLDPEDIRVLGVGAIWNFVKGTGLL